MEDLSHMLTGGINGHSGMAAGPVSPSPAFGAEGSAPQAPAPESPVPDVTDAPAEVFDYDEDGE